MAELVNQGTHSSASMVIKVRNREVGRANGVSINPDFGTQAVPKGIGSIMPAEHIPLEYRAEISIESFLIRKRTNTSGSTQGVQDVLGVPISEDILLTEPFNLEVVDKVTGAMLFVAENCTWNSQGINIRGGSITGKDCRASALNCRQSADYDPPFATG